MDEVTKLADRLARLEQQGVPSERLEIIFAAISGILRGETPRQSPADSVADLLFRLYGPEALDRAVSIGSDFNPSQFAEAVEAAVRSRLAPDPRNA